MKIISSDTEIRTIVTQTWEIPGISPDILHIREVYSDPKNKAYTFVQNRKGLYEDLYPKFVTREFFTLIQQYNPFIDYELFKDTYVEIEDSVKDGTNFSELTLVWEYHNGHVLFDKDLLPIPYARKYDYIGTRFSTRYSNLKELLEYLKKHPWVKNSDELELELIPYYNNDSGSHMYIAPYVLMLPDVQTYHKMYQEITSKKHPKGYISHWSCELHDAVVSQNVLYGNTDWLGIIPFLTSK